jgi:hypothetical protein
MPRRSCRLPKGGDGRVVQRGANGGCIIRQGGAHALQPSGAVRHGARPLAVIVNRLVEIGARGIAQRLAGGLQAQESGTGAIMRLVNCVMSEGGGPPCPTDVTEAEIDEAVSIIADSVEYLRSVAWARA